jgi:hypothetical protein
MHLFKITLAFSSMAALTLARAIGTVNWVSNELGIGMIAPEDGSAYIPMKVISIVCQSAPSIYPRLEGRRLLMR